ncbi:MAG: hypothetical protein IJB47_01920 [Oscillospiraceae bacterium]|nr:hypothetical protein [Oscillospiraceae bacterium]
MKYRVAAFLCVIFILTGCSKQSSLDRAIRLRSDIVAGNGCSFVCEITADYGEKIYTFGMDCQADREGNLSFTVTKPDTICGICGRITSQEGALTFDDRVLAFETIADDHLTPVSAPWFFLRAICSGYINSCQETESGYCIEIDDIYNGTSVALLLHTNADFVPVGGEIFWNNRRILTLQVDNFIIL